MSDLTASEDLALTYALAAIERGSVPTNYTASVCVVALARIVGRPGWTGVQAIASGASESSS